MRLGGGVPRGRRRRYRDAMTSAEVRRYRAGKVESVDITSLHGDGRTERPDDVVGEEPLEIRLGGLGQRPVSVGVTMRTPGNDFELAVGFLLSEGLLDDHNQVRAVRYCDLPSGEEQLYNIVSVDSAVAVDVDNRRRASTSPPAAGSAGRRRSRICIGGANRCRPDPPSR